MSQKLTIELMQIIAAERGGKCLSDTYKNVKTDLLWECADGHRWHSTPDNVKNQGHWCHECGGSKRSNIKEMRKIAAQRGGKCISKKYVNNITKLTWECEKGHRWDTTPNSIKSGKWCYFCAHNAPIGLEEAHKIAEENNGKCLSAKYVNARTPMLWECSDGHQWKASIDSVKNKGTWCLICSGSAKKSLSEAKHAAILKGGKCLSKEYINIKTPLDWECAEGHRWSAPFGAISSGSWCQACYGNLKLTIQDAHQIAAQNNGKCLSKHYENAGALLEWECSEGHKWKANMNSVRNQGTWCKRCNKFIAEEKCRAVFEQLTGENFPSVRPKWLRNPSTGYPLELDGYSEVLKIAFEYQGRQHYEKAPFFNATDIEERDMIKKKICIDNGVVLFIIPYTQELFDLPKFIETNSNIMNLDTKIFNFKKTPDFSQIRNFKSRLETCHSTAKERGGKFLSVDYKNAFQRLEWQCAKGHKWHAPWKSVVTRGTWCRKCSKAAPLKIEDMQEMANVHNGKCLSENYTNSKTKLLWECREGHQWLATPHSIRHDKTWCPTCRKTKKLWM